jgi:hypothetical protein
VTAPRLDRSGLVAFTVKAAGARRPPGVVDPTVQGDPSPRQQDALIGTIKCPVIGMRVSRSTSSARLDDDGL